MMKSVLPTPSHPGWLSFFCAVGEEGRGREVRGKEGRAEKKGREGWRAEGREKERKWEGKGKKWEEREGTRIQGSHRTTSIS